MVICVYKIVCLNPENNWCYIGSTKNLRNRMKAHKSDCHNIYSKNYNKKAYCFIRENGGYPNWKYEILEEFEEYDVKTLRKRELYYIDITRNNNLNYERPYTKDDNRLIRNIELSKIYHEKNIEKIKNYKKTYAIDNKEKIKKNKKEYYNKNKNIICQKQKEYYKNNPQKIKDIREKNREKKSIDGKLKIPCKYCNKILSKGYLPRHYKRCKKNI
jgi:predicted GIY-YIG superfamily endonuclease